MVSTHNQTPLPSTPPPSTYVAAQRVEEAGADGGANVAHRHHKALWRTLELRVVGEGVLGLGHANRQVVVALGLVALNFLLGLVYEERGGREGQRPRSSISLAY